MMLTCKAWHTQVIRNNQLWKNYFLRRDVRPLSGFFEVNVRSWYYMCCRKAEVARKRVPREEFSEIENCEFEFVCPLRYEELEAAGKEGERLCRECNKVVRQVDMANKEEIFRLAAAGECVAVHRNKRPMRMGKAAATRKHKDPKEKYWEPLTQWEAKEEKEALLCKLCCEQVESYAALYGSHKEACQEARRCKDCNQVAPTAMHLYGDHRQTCKK